MAGAIPVDAGLGGEAVSLLKALEKFGLIGPGSVGRDGRDPSKAAGGAPGYHLQGLVRGQVESAKQMEDLDNRLQGSTASSSHQMMMDAAWSHEKEKAERRMAEKEEAAAALLVFKRGTLEPLEKVFG